MYKHILLATDGSELATKALEHGFALAKLGGARVTVVTVTESWSAFEMAQEARAGRRDPIGEFDAAAATAANRILDAAGKRANALEVACQCLHVKDQRPAEGIMSTARNQECDLIVMGSHGRRGISRILLGSQAYEVLTLCKVPALIVR